MEYAVLNDIVALNRYAWVIHKLVPQDSEIYRFSSNMRGITPIVEKVNKAITLDAAGLLKAGDIIMMNLDKVSKFEYRDLFEYISTALVKLVTKHMHAVKFVGEQKISHATFGGTKTDTLGMYDVLTSDMYVINPNKLIKAEYKEKLKAKFGDAYADEVDEIYRLLEVQIHKDSHEYFNVFARESMGMLQKGLFGVMPYLGYNKVIGEDLNDIYSKVVNFEYNQNTGHRMLCSEFVARTSVASLLDLDKQLKEALGITNPDEHVINMPFSKFERFSKMHPDRLLEVLGEAGCIEKVESKTQQHFIS